MSSGIKFVVLVVIAFGLILEDASARPGVPAGKSTSNF